MHVCMSTQQQLHVNYMSAQQLQMHVKYSSCMSQANFFVAALTMHMCELLAVHTAPISTMTLSYHYLGMAL